MKKLLIFVCIFLFAFSGFSETLFIDPNDVKCEMSDTLYGLFFEDINCAADGGLYPEILLNRSFEYQSLLNPQRHDRYTGWRMIRIGYGDSEWELRNDNPIHVNNETYLSVSVKNGAVNLMNQGFNGSALRGDVKVFKDQKYDLSLYARSDDFEGEIVVSVTNSGAVPVTETMRIEPNDTWTKYEMTVTAERDTNGFFTIEIIGDGNVDIDMASCMPSDRTGKEWPGGGIRTDIFETLKALNPKFLRFPGGCVAEGSHFRSNFYNWKDTVGPVETRKENANTWGGMQTYGIGFYEYFMMCEALGAYAVPVVHAGVLCQAREIKEPLLSVEETKAYAQDILDLIEFATGDNTSEWGSLRAEMGHPDPFELKYIAIGNENWAASYFTRYGILEKIVKEAYPNITTIVAAGPVAEGGLINDSWNNIRRSFSDSLVDEHYYMDSGWFLKNTNRYDRYPRTTKVFLGEFAAHEPVQGSRRPNNLYAALCEAAYLTGIERNSDLVEMCCYAPLLARDGMVDWTPNLIWFNEKDVLLTPSFHIQKMFSENTGDQVLNTGFDLENVYHVVTKTKDAIQIKIVNVSEDEKSIDIEIMNGKTEKAEVTELSGKRSDTNSFVKPEKVVPVSFELEFENGESKITLKPMSCTIIVVPMK